MSIKTISKIILENDDLHFFSIEKPSKEISSWTFTSDDKTSKLYNVKGKLSDYTYKKVSLKRDNHFFKAYKIYIGNDFEYYVDTKKCNHRYGASHYVESLMKYNIYSNDISIMKSDSSFRYTKYDMMRDGVENYLDLCVKFKDYSSIGNGITRNIRNLIVLDIDVNCEKPDNVNEINSIILKCGEYDFVPDFYIFNHESKHVQLQWLIRNCEYKKIVWELVNKKIEEINQYGNRELPNVDFNFTELSDGGLKYRVFTKGLTYLSTKYKFGDKNYTFWKSKNFYTALHEKYGLELRMPYVKNGEIFYRTKDEMLELFRTKESRKKYFDESPTLEMVYEKTKEMMKVPISKVSETSVKKIVDGSEDTIKKSVEKRCVQTGVNDNDEESRNQFVFNNTRTTAWETFRNMNYHNKDDIIKLSDNKFNSLKRKVKKLVKEKFNSENEKYGGVWPGTTNISIFTQGEFDNTFNNSYKFAVEQFNNTSYTDFQRDKSLDERRLKKSIRLVMIDYLLSSNNEKITHTKLLEILNVEMSGTNHKKISYTTLKRDLNELKSYTPEQKLDMYDFVISKLNERRNELMCMSESGLKSRKEMNICRKKLNRIDFNLLNVIDFNHKYKMEEE